MKHTTVAIIGVGAVGSTIAYALMLKNRAAEIILIDSNIKRCAGEVRDLTDVLGFSSTASIYQGSYGDAKRADIVIICAGKPQAVGQPRLDLIVANSAIMKSVLDNLNGINPQALLLIVANPLDLLTWYAYKNFELPKAQIFGAGTFLDSQRLKNLLASRCAIADSSIQAFVIGEHGDSQMVPWSALTIGGLSADQWHINASAKQDIENGVKNEAYAIIEAKGATFYGIATCVAELCEIIIFNKKVVVPLSWYHPAYDVCMSLPVVLGEKGIEKVIELELSPDEQAKLLQSADTLKAYAKMANI